MMKSFPVTGVAVVLSVLLTTAAGVEVIQAFHFHTYFLQENRVKVHEVKELRELISKEIATGGLRNCSLNHLNLGPRGPHPIGSFETCCNVSSLDAATSFFMKNHGKFSVLLHPLTKQQLKDHTERAMWIGLPMPLDVEILDPVLDETPICPVYGNVSVSYDNGFVQ